METRTDQLLHELITNVSQIPALQPAELGNVMYPSDIILALHNHLGNIKQLLNGSLTASNGTDKYYALKGAEKELDELGDTISSAAYTGLITNEQYPSLRDKAEELARAIHDEVDTDYEY